MPFQQCIDFTEPGSGEIWHNPSVSAALLGRGLGSCNSRGRTPLKGKSQDNGEIICQIFNELRQMQQSLASEAD